MFNKHCLISRWQKLSSSFSIKYAKQNKMFVLQGALHNKHTLLYIMITSLRTNILFACLFINAKHILTKLVSFTILFTLTLQLGLPLQFNPTLP